MIFGNVWSARNADYTFVVGFEETHSIAYPSVSLWQNTGAGGTQQKGDGARYCDMTGTGSDDYVWMGIDGTMWLFGNIHDPPNWYQVRNSIPSPPNFCSASVYQAPF